MNSIVGMAALPEAGGPLALRQAFADLIREVYKEHNNEKLDQVGTLLEKYEGYQQDLYLLVCKKYGVRPKDPEGLGYLDWLYVPRIT